MEDGMVGENNSRYHESSVTQTWFWDPWPPRTPEGPCCLYLLPSVVSHSLGHPHYPSAFPLWWNREVKNGVHQTKALVIIEILWIPGLQNSLLSSSFLPLLQTKEGEIHKQIKVHLGTQLACLQLPKGHFIPNYTIFPFYQIAKKQ